MIDAQRSLATEQLLEMRTPLSRVALVAEALAREAARPGARAQVTTLLEAVGDLDRRLGRILALLAPAPASAAAPVALAAALAEVHSRVGPALAARGIEVELGPSPDARVHDPTLLRRCALALLQLSAERLGRVGRVELHGLAEAHHWGVGIELRPGSAADSGAGPSASLNSVALVVEPFGGRVEPSEVGGRLRVRCWIPVTSP